MGLGALGSGWDLVTLQRQNKMNRFSEMPKMAIWNRVWVLFREGWWALDHCGVAGVRGDDLGASQDPKSNQTNIYF